MAARDCTDAAKGVICSIGPEDPTEVTSGFCYVQRAATRVCGQAILFSPGTPPAGATIDLPCIEQTSGIDATPAAD